MVDLAENEDTQYYYHNPDYNGDDHYAIGWFVSYHPSGRITEAIALLDTGERRDITGKCCPADFYQYPAASPPEKLPTPF